MNKIDIVQSDGWEVMYINGEKETEGHGLESCEFIEVINEYKNFSKANYYYIEYDIVENELNCNFPDKFQEIPKEFLE